MSTGTGIEWTEATWNPIAGCTPVSPGCLNCYAATMSARLAAMGQQKYVGLTVKRDGRQVFNGRINFDEAALSIPLKRKPPTMYFVNSMSDLFHEDVPQEFVARVFDTMWQTEHVYQILTKRPDRMACSIDALLYPALADKMLENIWLGTSVEGVAQLNRINQLRGCRAVVRFLSLEPLLEDLGGLNLRGIHWVIVGGESGVKARPCNVDWVRSIVRQCQAAAVPVFVKQLGSNVEWSGTQGGYGDGPSNCWPEGFDHEQVNGGWRVRLRDKKGGYQFEWPEDLRIREMPDAKVPA
jgi:protein gp37